MEPPKDGKAVREGVAHITSDEHHGGDVPE